MTEVIEFSDLDRWIFGFRNMQEKFILACQLKVIRHYSHETYRCACYKKHITETMLEIDHIHGNGRKVRQQIAKELGRKSGSQITSHEYSIYLISNGFPLGHHVVCVECNKLKGPYDKCLHQDKERMKKRNERIELMIDELSAKSQKQIKVKMKEDGKFPRGRSYSKYLMDDLIQAALKSSK